MEIKLKTTKKPNLHKPILICGMPGSGYVGKIAIDYLIKQFNAKQICQIESNLFPPQVIIKNDGTSENIKYRIYKLENKTNKKDLLILTGESQPTTSESNYLISEKIIEYINKIGVKEVYTLAAYITGEFIKQPKVFGTSTHIKQIKQMKKSGIIIMKEGIITGMNGLLIGMAKIHGMKGTALLGETSGYVFDHNSSKAVLQSLNKLLKMNINTEYLNVKTKANDELLSQIEQMKQTNENEGIKYEENKDLQYIS